MSSQGVQQTRDRVTDWMRDGRADLVVAAFDASWSSDAYLMLQYGEALGALDRLNDAGDAYRRAKSAPGVSDAQVAFADRRLAWLDDEWRRIGEVRAGLGRSWMVGATGLALLGAAAGFAWIIARREKVSKTTG